MDEFDWPRNLPVKELKERAKHAAAKLKAEGYELTPVASTAQSIATSFWGKAWCRNLELYSDYASRLPRGRSYLRNGAVLDLQITSGRVEAKVQGTRLYDLSIRIEPLDAERWAEVRERSKGEVASLLDLLAGRIGASLMAIVTDKDTGLFPSTSEIRFTCTCPDDADMCKHTAAVLYGIGVRLDERPELLFALRGVDHKELVTAAVEDGLAGQPVADLDSVDLGNLFGIELGDD